MILRILICLICVTCLIGCIGSYEQTPAENELPLPSQTLSVQGTVDPTRLPISTEVQVATQTIIPMPTIKPPVEPTATGAVPTTETSLSASACITLPEEPLQPGMLTGYLILAPRTLDPQPVIMLNLETGQQSRLSETDPYPYYVRVSPDREWVAYEAAVTASSTPNQVLFVQRGNYPEPYWFEEMYKGINVWLIGWYGNQMLATKSYNNPDNPDYDTPLVLDIETGEYRELPVIFPNLMTNEFRHWPSLTVFDPTLRRVVYLANNWTLVYWDILANQQVAVFEDARITYEPPKWDDQGEKFVLIGGNLNFNEFVIVNWDGVVIHETNYPDTVGTRYGRTLLAGYTWAPDGGSLAYWMYQDLGIFLGVYSLKDDASIEYCLRFDIENSYAAQPIWSPDGQFLAVAVANEDDNLPEATTVVGGEFQTVIVDIRNEKSFLVTKNMIPFGWLKP